MAVAGLAKTVSWVASGDLSASQYMFVKHGATAGEVAVCGAGEVGIGILVNKPTAQGQIAEVAMEGRALLVVGAAAAVLVGALIKSDAAGKAITASVDKDFAIARALQAGDVSDVIEVELGPFSKQSI